MDAAGVDVGTGASTEVGFDGVAKGWLAVELVAGGCADAASSVATFGRGSGATELSGLVSRVAVAVATESASVRTSVTSGSTMLLVLLFPVPLLIGLLSAAAAEAVVSTDSARVWLTPVATSTVVDALQN